ncbi:MAG TPA: N-6 DNA methylase [Sedimentisphaerales bacterium]|nr:N-6 DNA methylase [Sedimentisphaerales bacterium]
MEKKDKELLEKYIITKDKKCTVVKIEFSTSYETGKVKYSDKIKQHRHIEELTDEELVRAYLVVKLVKELKYPIESLELEKEWEIGRKGKKPWARARADIIVRNKNDNFMLIEVKAPSKYDTDIGEIKTQLFNVASLAKKNLRYLIYYTAEIFANSIQEKLITIDCKKYKEFDDWENAGRPNLLGIPKEYGFIRRPIFIRDVNDLITNIDQNGFNRLRKELHNVLWGGGELSDTDIFNNLVKIFLSRIYDEKETPSKKPYKFQVEYKVDESSGEVIEETNDELLEKVTKLYKAALKEYLGYSEKEIQNSNIDVSKFTLNKLKYVIETFQSISITKNEYDLLGGFFESIVWSGFKQTKGQFFTPIDIVQFILLTLRIDELCLKIFKEEKRLPYIVDPACGSGTFLIEIMKHITNTILDNKTKVLQSERLQGLFNSCFPKHQENYWANKFIYGIEINQDLATSSKVNMVMHGDGSANIICDNALLTFDKYIGKLSKTKTIKNHPYIKPLNENYDILISNPPFSLDLGVCPSN